MIKSLSFANNSGKKCPIKLKNWHAVSLEQYFLSQCFFDICPWVFKKLPPNYSNFAFLNLQLFAYVFWTCPFAFKWRIQNKIYTNNKDIGNRCKSSKYSEFDINSIEKAVEYLIRNCYFAIRDYIFNKLFLTLWDQTQHQFSVTFFFYYEWQKLNNLKKENVIYVTPKSLSYIQIYSWSNYYQ